MKKSRWFSVFPVFFLCFIMLVYSGQVSDFVRKTLLVVEQTLFPSLFLYLLCGSLLSELCLGVRTPGLLSRFMRGLFGMDGAAAAILFIGIFCGYPMGILALERSFLAGEISQSQAKRLSLFTSNPSCAFCVSLLGGVLESPKSGFIVWVMCVFSSLVFGVALHLFWKREKDFAKAPRARQNAAVTDALFSAIRRATRAFLTIAVLFISTRTALFFVAALCRKLSICEGVVCVINGLLEVSGGVLSLAALPEGLRLYAASFFMGFGGICVFLQSRESLRVIGTKTSVFLQSRALCGLLSGIFLFCFTKLFALL